MFKVFVKKLEDNIVLTYVTYNGNIEEKYRKAKLVSDVHYLSSPQ